MNPTLHTWTRYLEGESLTIEEQRLLVQLISTDESQLRALVEEQSVDRLLRFAAERKTDDHFVKQCVSRFSEMYPPTGVDDIPTVQIRVERKTSVDDAWKQIGQRRRRAVWKLAAMVTAASILLVCLLLVINRDGPGPQVDQQPSDAIDAQQTTENQSSTPAMAGNDPLPAMEDLDLPALPDSDLVEMAETGPDWRDDAASLEDKAVDPANNLMEQGNLSANETTWGTIEESPDARWLNRPSGERLPTGPLKLVFGSARLNLDNQVQVQILAPQRSRSSPANRCRSLRGRSS